MSEDIFGYHNWRWREGLQLASSEWRPEMLLNILQCIKPAPDNKELSNLKCEEFEKPLPEP